jgi:hypothetical protein
MRARNHNHLGILALFLSLACLWTRFNRFNGR